MNNNIDTAQLEDTQKALTTYQNGKYNLLNLPAITAQDGDYELSVTIVPIDAADRQLVYPTPGRPGHLSLHAVALRLLAHAAGVRFSGTRTYYDPAGNPTCTLLARVQAAPNDWRTCPGTYQLDIAARCEELRLAAEKKSGDERKRALKELPALQARTRRFATQLAETGAMNRALRALLNVRGSYPRQALDQPFVVATMRYNPQAPALREAQRIMAQDAVATLFGDDVEAPNETAVRFAQALIEATGGPRSDTAPAAPPAPEVLDVEGDPDRPLNDWYNDPDVSPVVSAGLEALGLTPANAAQLLDIDDLSRFPGDTSSFWYRLKAALGT